MQYFFFNPSFLDRKWTRKTTKFFQGFTMEKYNVIYSKLFETSCTIFQISYASSEYCFDTKVFMIIEKSI